MVNIVPGYGAVAGAALVAHHMVAKVMFTGSTVTGKRIAAEAANTLKPIGLELGGKSAVIVYEDAPIDQAAQIATTAIFSNQGQICTAGSRLLLHAEIHDKVLEKVVENAKRVKIGDQMDPSTTMGPLISVRQKERVRGYIESGKRSDRPELEKALAACKRHKAKLDRHDPPGMSRPHDRVRGGAPAPDPGQVCRVL